MKILNNPELKKLFISFLLILFIFIVIAYFMSYLSIKQFKKTIEDNNAAILGTIVEKYPDAEQHAISQILNPNEDTIKKGYSVMSKYGFNPSEVFIYTNLIQKNFRTNVLLYLLLIIFVSASFILITLLFVKAHYGNINELIDYIRRIKANNYSLDIRDNSEGDISILKNEVYKITTALREQTQVLEKDKASLADSIADISHQIKTPMTSLFVLTDLLYNNPPEETKEEFLNKMKSQLNRIEWLVTSLLKLSKLEAGTVIMKKEPVSVNKLVHKAMESMVIPADIKQIHVRICGNGNITYAGDFNWTSEALVNIIKNCIEHTPEKGNIEIMFDKNPIYTLIAINDDGVGIDKEDIPYIFNRFYKGKNAGDDSVGIGLAMARTIILKQGGDITVESEKGYGTKFIIKFYAEREALI